MNDTIPSPFTPPPPGQVSHWRMVQLPPEMPDREDWAHMEIDGQDWLDGQLTLDANGSLWRLTAYATIGESDTWVWREFGSETEQPLDSETVERPLQKVWLIDEKGTVRDHS